MWLCKLDTSRRRDYTNRRLSISLADQSSWHVSLWEPSNVSLVVCFQMGTESLTHEDTYQNAIIRCNIMKFCPWSPHFISDHKTKYEEWKGYKGKNQTDINWLLIQKQLSVMILEDQLLCIHSTLSASELSTFVKVEHIKITRVKASIFV